MSRDVSEREGRKALADCLWGASYERDTAELLAVEAKWLRVQAARGRGAFTLADTSAARIADALDVLAALYRRADAEDRKP